MTETKRDVEVRMAWEDRFEAWRKLMPDSRLRNRTMSVPSPLGEVQRVFCLHCACPMGGVTKDPTLPEHTVLFICRPCAATHGGLSVPQIPEDVLRAMRRA